MGGFKVPKSDIKSFENKAKEKCSELANEAMKKLDDYYVKNVLNPFYAEYSPKIYERTYTLYNNSHHTWLKKNHGCLFAHFEMSNDSMHYYRKNTNPNNKEKREALVEIKNRRTLGEFVEYDIWERREVAWISFWESTHGWHVPSSIHPWFEMSDYADELIDYYTEICKGD